MGREEGGLVGLGVVYSTVFHGEPQSWFGSCGGCWVSADTGLSGVGAWLCQCSEAGAVFRNRTHLWLGSEPELRMLG